MFIHKSVCCLLRHSNLISSRRLQNRFLAALLSRKMSMLREKLIKSVDDNQVYGGNKKITIVGCGQVGMACAICILSKKISNEICLIDTDNKKLTAELMDLQHGSIYLNSPTITASSDYSITENSRICIITAGAGPKKDQSRLDIAQGNVDIIKELVPKLVAKSPETVLMVVTNPVDILTYVAWKYSGFTKNRVLGTGTSLDSARFCYLISQKLCVAPASVHGWIIGEHGDSSVPVWSSVNVAGVRLRELNDQLGIADDVEKWNELHQKVVQGGYEIVRNKGYTSWAVALCAAEIASCILNNTSTLVPVSTYIKGEQCIDKEIFLSLPCILNSNGATAIVKQNLSDTEMEQLHDSAKTIFEVQNGLSM